MKFRIREVAVLDRDLAEHGPLKGDLGTIVHVYEPDGIPDGIEVEFVSATGKTEALLTLKESDLRPLADGDPMTVRRLDPTR